ncbi:hypothetical protein GCM10023221_33540 [Luteimicrobium xylanilyticum]|uniref:Uncharacterized protein n=1 Tax=Luteimicrobium xylanilyticum TaxID=1133546 RepID=A0A5P9Q9P6_9MICO|nr:hypothetical protein [Luteimicrobium xylanilyticum]QFU98154.1 hypothetical protein KDY119_01663 [Luteimicrobium xylanilyticum]
MPEGARPSAQLHADLFVSVDGFAGGEGLPAYFGYPGPGLERWIRAEQAVDVTWSRRSPGSSVPAVTACVPGAACRW